MAVFYGISYTMKFHCNKINGCGFCKRRSRRIDSRIERNRQQELPTGCHIHNTLPLITLS